MERKNTRKIKVGNIYIGGNAPISIQSMTFAKTRDREATLSQILELERAGCEIVRFSVPDEESAESIPYLKEYTHIPLVADIHFNYRLAIKSAEYGIDKVRINPGNIGSDENVKAVVDVCKKKNIPIRIGVNAGSLEKHILAKYGKPTPEALVESATYHLNLLEKFDFYNTVVSIKSSDVQTTIAANRLFSQRFDYPLHLGLTEAGTERFGIIKSSCAIGSLLCDGIGDTIRVSLTENCTKEVYAARDLLKSIGLRSGVNIISCPTCARCDYDVIGIANKLHEHLDSVTKNITVAVMGCAVNGPGEAREADIGVAGGKGEALLFKKGEAIGKIPENEVIERILKEVEAMS
ncbi:MAG: flavodoxin-dependent (E)-4-hydroxy-3-methylbut-2-enyl-diphosphate synthase [Clostridia bacterium]|nr:flavodoxin-dependent (E)-4-hydroxy-3-methylbut-2-enyl-diphosphate synthase [Clostridia bacterium]